MAPDEKAESKQPGSEQKQGIWFGCFAYGEAVPVLVTRRGEVDRAVSPVQLDDSVAFGAEYGITILSDAAAAVLGGGAAGYDFERFAREHEAGRIAARTKTPDCDQRVYNRL